MTALLLISGVTLLLLLAADVFGTVFNPEGHGGPLTRVQGRLLWRAWKALAPRGGAAREAWLALGGPFLAVLTPANWALILVAGFALIFYPWIEGFLVSPGSLRAPWAEVLYYSGFSAATLGTGDVVAHLPALRLLTIVEALSGFALLSASLSYILAIYRENGKKASLASELALHHEVRRGAGEPDWAGEDRLWLERVARELLHITNAHAQYPILHFFRPKNRSSSLTVQIAPLVGGVGRDRQSSSAAGGGKALVAAAVDRYLEAADRRFVPGSSGGGNQSIEARYARLLEYLGYAAEDAGGPPEK